MKDAYPEEFLRRLRESINFKKEQEVFERMLGKAAWEVLPAVAAKSTPPHQNLWCGGKGFERFQLGEGHGFSAPLKQGNQVYGVVVARGFKYPITDELIAVFSAFTDAVMREVQKEMELTKLYDTIRPRAIALSTIHTVHRLISSTLDLEELMPRIARLCLQVMRAEVCDIYMLDKNKKRFILKGTTRNIKQNQKKFSVRLTGIFGRVFRTGASVLTPKKILVPLIDEDVAGFISIRNKLADKGFSEFDKEILTTFAEQAVIAIRNAQLYEEQERLTIGSIKALAALLDTRPSRLATHSAIFVKLTTDVAKELGMSVSEIRVLKYASFLHDAGKLTISDEILMKPKRLTGEEFKVMKKHPIKGVEIVRPIEVLKPVIPIILHHHEKFDGTGYPKGLKGKEIPLGSRIMAVVDAFVAMISKQPYRESVSAQEAISEIKRYSGTQFDPDVVDAFIRVAGNARDFKKLPSDEKFINKIKKHFKDEAK